MVEAPTMRARVLAITLAIGGCNSDDASVAPDGTTDTGGSSAASVDDGSESGPGTGLDSGDTTGAGSCAMCAPPAPDGWKGPVVRTMPADGEPAACGGGWPDADLAFFDDYIEPGPTTCSCECETDVSMVCYTGVWRHDGTATCDSYTEFLTLHDECAAFDSTIGSMTFNSIGQGEPECKAKLDSDVPEPAWGQLISSCKGATSGEACDEVADGVCWPAPPEGFEGGLCVWAQGDEPCPAGTPYQDRELVYNGVADDTRTCSVCTCSDLDPVDCTGDVEVFGSDDCSGAVSTSLPQDMCTEVDGVASARLALDVPGTCDKLSETAPVGSIDVSGGVFTYCCTAAG